MYANKVNGATKSGSSVTSAFDYILISSTVKILPLAVVSNGSTGDAPSQAALDKLIEVISLRGQPVIIGAPAYDGSANYTMRVAVEHTGSWSNATPTLLASIGTHAVDYAFTTSNTTVTITTGL